MKHAVKANAFIGKLKAMHSGTARGSTSSSAVTGNIQTVHRQI